MYIRAASVKFLTRKFAAGRNPVNKQGDDFFYFFVFTLLGSTRIWA